MKFKVGDTVRIRNDLKADQRYGFHIANQDMVNMGGNLYTIEEIRAFSDHITYKLEGSYWAWTEEMLEPADNIVRMADGTIIGDFSTGGFCDGFRGGKIPVVNDLIVSPTEMERTMDRLLEALEKPSVKFGIKELEQKLKEDKKLKFTFYFNVNEGTRVDKSCNGTIPTITTSVVLDKFGDPDRRKCYSLEGEATCDKADYDMRQGVLEALANAVFDGNFEKAYDKAVKTNAFCERQDRTCHYCGKVLDTVEEKEAHEAWHVERKKARRERYLLRKRAKEIAFEEQAQKMAKEMIEK